MAGDAPTLVYDIANDLLVIGEAALREGGCDPIHRAHIETGNTLAPVEFPDDDPNAFSGQLTVTAGPFYPDLITDLVQRRQGKAAAAMLWKCRFAITLLRPFPMWSGDEQNPLPSPALLNEKAAGMYRDIWQLARVYAWKWTHGELVPSYPFDGENVQWPSPAGTIRPPQGGITGWDITFTVSIHDQYVPETVTPEFLT